MAWTVREGATNVIRHSGARHCSVTVRAQAGDAGVEVLAVDHVLVDVGGRAHLLNEETAAAAAPLPRPTRVGPVVAAAQYVREQHVLTLEDAIRKVEAESVRRARAERPPPRPAPLKPPVAPAAPLAPRRERPGLSSMPSVPRPETAPAAPPRPEPPPFLEDLSGFLFTGLFEMSGAKRGYLYITLTTMAFSAVVLLMVWLRQRGSASIDGATSVWMSSAVSRSTRPPRSEV